ncbi:protein-glutamate methylesterase/protein-glutamine glutaminase [Gimesia maris]|uniref:Protein-glutamate methylesterase/protein-glutamine glutaminase n=1 Tax=Gimesia maris TaxID=122 RepID=A0A3D3R401_9PLAN|nr:chemotaxis response regulator protein-glutamate methylesterase [Gimesia maris]MAC52626.1 chemotaxis response regulator protein-glutamate methylesterase [Gimesia sp.]HAW29484.1 chemotaxis response regulator protein-glutamate methylesterase [Planctomycetaceae bacterium]EDL59844.1 Two component CheB methylesterase [Gimesia maris DSM 8797]QDU14692.1 Chemotaxis response regulator protein-glutamate methylesterase of group 2 operon [Gimesia maris]QEG16669.1 Chemotaxis response regulator protein-gl
MSHSIIKVLLVDDSAVIRGLMTQAINLDAEVKVVGSAMHGQTALTWLKANRADVVVLDVEMPVMDGISCLKQLKQDYPELPVIMASSLTRAGAEVTLQALDLGAAGCIPKPVATNSAAAIEQVARDLLPLIKALVKKHSTDQSDCSRFKTAVVQRPAKTPMVMVVGSSTGGPNALKTMLTALPEKFSLPILIAQHMPPLFTRTLAEHIERETKRPTSEARDGALIERGHIYIAPGDFHMVIDKQDDRMIIRLNQDAPEHFCRPSVNPLYASAAKWYGSSVLAVMLTGMGDDGIEGAESISERKGYIIAQDEQSSVVWGMPGAIAKAGLASQVLPLRNIAPELARLCSL